MRNPWNLRLSLAATVAALAIIGVALLLSSSARGAAASALAASAAGAAAHVPGGAGCLAEPTAAASPGRVLGSIVADRMPPGGTLVIPELGRTADIAQDGTFEVEELAPGCYGAILLLPGRHPLSLDGDRRICAEAGAASFVSILISG